MPPFDVGYSERKLTVPNVVTTLRMVMSLVAGWCFGVGQWERSAVAICLVAALLDAFDGWYARRFSQATHLGKHLDPLADKLLIAVVYLAIAHTLSFALVWFLVIAIGVREVAMTAFRSYSYRRFNKFIPANRWGKSKMIVQSAVGVSILGYIYYASGGIAIPMPVVVAPLIVILVISYVSAGVYVRAWRAIPRAVPESEEIAGGDESHEMVVGK